MQNSAHNLESLDPHQVQQAEHTWQAFTRLSKWAIGHVIVLLILMALFLL